MNALPLAALLAASVHAGPVPSFESIVGEAGHAAHRTRAAQLGDRAVELDARMRRSAAELRRLERDCSDLSLLLSELKRRLHLGRLAHWEVRRVGLALAELSRGLDASYLELQGIRRSLNAPDPSLHPAADRLSLAAGWLRAAERRLGLEAAFIEFDLRRAGFVLEARDYGRRLREIDLLGAEIESEAREILSRAR